MNDELKDELKERQRYSKPSMKGSFVKEKLAYKLRNRPSLVSQNSQFDNTSSEALLFTPKQQNN